MRWKTEVERDIRDRFALMKAVSREQAPLLLADLDELFAELRESPEKGMGKLRR